MEAAPGVALVNRTTRRMSLTPEGELGRQCARRILGEIDELGQSLQRSRQAPRGSCASTRRWASAAATWRQ